MDHTPVRVLDRGADRSQDPENTAQEGAVDLAAVLAEARIVLVSRPGCHLCRLARGVVEKVAGDVGVTWREVLITELADPDPLWWEQVPVTLVDGGQHDYWRVSESRLRAALAATP